MTDERVARVVALIHGHFGPSCKVSLEDPALGAFLDDASVVLLAASVSRDTTVVKLVNALNEHSGGLVLFKTSREPLTPVCVFAVSVEVCRVVVVSRWVLITFSPVGGRQTLPMLCSRARSQQLPPRDSCRPLSIYTAPLFFSSMAGLVLAKPWTLRYNAF